MIFYRKPDIKRRKHSLQTVYRQNFSLQWIFSRSIFEARIFLGFLLQCSLSEIVDEYFNSFLTASFNNDHNR